MGQLESTWSSLIYSIEIHRDARARYFKPTCIFAVCNVIDKNIESFPLISAELVMEEFRRLTSELFPDKANQGWMPMWHLMRDGAWICKKDGAATLREVFPLTKPRSKKEMLEAVDTIDCSKKFGALWKSKESRQQLRKMMCALLLADRDENANLMGEYLLALNVDSISHTNSSRDLNLNKDDANASENYAKFRVHLRIERDAKIPIAVKKIQGYSCLACGFNFEKKYGKLGSNYIEVHHVIPVAKSKGTHKQVRLTDDFIVLCSNCHRMIHRLGEPWTRDRLKDLKAVLTLNLPSAHNN